MQMEASQVYEATSNVRPFCCFVHNMSPWSSFFASKNLQWLMTQIQSWKLRVHLSLYNSTIGRKKQSKIDENTPIQLCIANIALFQSLVNEGLGQNLFVMSTTWIRVRSIIDYRFVTEIQS